MESHRYDPDDNGRWMALADNPDHVQYDETDCLRQHFTLTCRASSSKRVVVCEDQVWTWTINSNPEDRPPAGAAKKHKPRQAQLPQADGLLRHGFARLAGTINYL